MSELPPFKLAFIGSHGVGKTTLCYGLAARLKRRDVGLELVHEVARRCPLPINQETGVAAQSWILHSQIAEELVAATRFSVVLCDRSVLDNYIYLLLAAGPQEALEALVHDWMATYDLLIHVPILEPPSANGVRDVDPSFQQAVEERLSRELEARCLAAVRLDPAARSEWIDSVERLVCERLEPLQLRLL